MTTKPAGHEDVIFATNVQVTADATNATFTATEGRRPLFEGFGQLPQLEDGPFVPTLLGLMTKIYSSVI